ncbi:MAG: TVP38/TMEM64 family protein [Pseudomonadota bacterium]
MSFQALADNRETLLAWRDNNYLMVALLYALIYVAVVAFSLPGGLVMTLTGGFLFGAIVGASLTVFSATIGASAIFLAAKSGLGDALHAKLNGASSGGILKRIENGLRENEVSYLLMMRLVPAIPFFVANLAPAFLGVKLRNYVLTTFFGIIPGTAVYAWVGSGLGEVFDRGETPNLGIIFEPQVLGPILGLAALSALPILLKSFRKEDR